MDIKQIIMDVAKQIMEDKSLLNLFQKDPVKALEKVLNVDLPDDLINPVIDGIKAKLAVDSIGNVADDLFKKLF